MKSYGLDMQGTFKPEVVSSLPPFSPEYERKIVYNLSDNSYYFGTNTRFVKVSGFLNFKELEDTPKSYANYGNKILKCKRSEDGIDFGAISVQNLISNSDLGIWSNGVEVDYSGELVSNGTFDSNLSGWSGTNANLIRETSGGVGNTPYLRIENTSNSTGYAQSSTITGLYPNRLYRFSFYVKEYSIGSNTPFKVSIRGSSYTKEFSGNSSNNWTKYNVYFVSDYSTIVIRLYCNSPTSGYSVCYDSLSVKEITVANIAENTITADGFLKTPTLATYRDQIVVKEGFNYSIKCIPSTTVDELTLNLDTNDINKFIGSFITFGCWVKTNIASGCRLTITNGTATDYSNFHTGSNNWEWLELPVLITSASSFKVGVRFYLAGSTTYICGPCLTIGNFIGNCNKPYSGMVLLDNPVSSIALGENKTYSTNNDYIGINIVEDTIGKLPKNCKGIYCKAKVKDSGSSNNTCYLRLNGKFELFEVDNSKVPNDTVIIKEGYQPCYKNNVNNFHYSYKVKSSGTNTFTIVDFKIYGIEI